MATSTAILAPFLLYFTNLVAAVTTSTCDNLSPPHIYHLNDTILNCYFPLGVVRDTFDSCKVEDVDANKFPRCVAHAKCVKSARLRTGYSDTFCICQSGYKMTSYFTCDKIKGEGGSCQFWEIDVPDGPTEQTDDCDASLGLTCSDGVCQCRERLANGICMLEAGELCRLDESGRNATAQCATASICTKFSEDESIFGLCKCEEGYHLWGPGQGCQKLMGFGEQCEQDNYARQCNDDLGLYCGSGTCTCNYLYPDSVGICIIGVGNRCSSGHTQTRCPGNASCTDSVCTCNKGFHADNDYTECKLLKFRGETCDDSTQTMCDSTSGLTCKNGKCQCKRELSKDMKFCTVDTRDECNLQATRAQCTPNSSCSRQSHSYPGSPVGKCKCLEGFISGWYDGKCHTVLGKGETCARQNNYQEHFCNKALGLECKGAVCSCSNGETVDGKCKLKVGNQCKLGNGGIFPTCPPNSKCQNSGDENYCRCKKPFLSAPDGSSCVPARDYMETCGNEEGVCLYNLLCREGRCQCRGDKVFDPDKEECKSSSSCEHYWDCPSRSSCVPIHAGSTSRKCQCDDGYSKDRSLCKSNYMTTCTKSADCFTTSSMECIDGVCACAAPFHQIYNPITKECVGLVGAPCGTENRKCVETAFCGADNMCRCPPGATLLDNGKCAKFSRFGAKCAHGGESCNPFKGLACVNNACACVDPNFTYLKDQEMCVAKEGDRCGLEVAVGKCVEGVSGAFNFPCHYYKVTCGGNTSCKETERSGFFRCLA